MCKMNLFGLTLTGAAPHTAACEANIPKIVAQAISLMLLSPIVLHHILQLRIPFHRPAAAS